MSGIPDQSQPALGRSFASRLVGNVVYPLWARRDHPAYGRYKKEFDRTQFYSAAQLEELQSTRLRQQLIHAYRNIPFYRRRMEQIGITPLDIRTTADLALLPILTKRDIQDHGPEMLAENIGPDKRTRNQTGGSTGSPLQFWVDNERFDSRRASTDRHNAWAGFRPGDWYAELWGNRLDINPSVLPTINWKERLLHRNLTLNTSSISSEDLDAYIEILRHYRPKSMSAYAQAAAMFASYCREKGVTDIHFDSVITTAEVLLPEKRKIIEEVFGAQVFNRYGSRETSVIASECKYHTGMHVNADALMVEIEPAPGLPDGLGRVLVTDMLNRSMPLIRYEIGDLASWSDPGPCPCGIVFPRLARLEGRITDFLSLPDHRKISGPSLTLVVSDMPDVRQVQFVQLQPDKVTLKVVPGAGYGADTVAELRRRLDPYLRGAADLSIVCVDVIPAEASGKYRFVKTSSESEASQPVAVE
jgi:phenylacetate-CoA ligase